jgi:hypothetical protein
MRGVNALWTAIRRIGSVVHQTLREIFDESAYKRFLLRERMQPSKAAYRAFLREHERTKIRQPRCC